MDMVPGGGPRVEVSRMMAEVMMGWEIVLVVYLVEAVWTFGS